MLRNFVNVDGYREALFLRVFVRGKPMFRGKFCHGVPTIYPKTGFYFLSGTILFHQEMLAGVAIQLQAGNWEDNRNDALIITPKSDVRKTTSAILSTIQPEQNLVLHFVSTQDERKGTVHPLRYAEFNAITISKLKMSLDMWDSSLPDMT